MIFFEMFNTHYYTWCSYNINLLSTWRVPRALKYRSRNLLSLFKPLMHSGKRILLTKFTICLCLFTLTNFTPVLFCFKVEVPIRFMVMSAGVVQWYQTSTRREGVARKKYFPKRCDLEAHKTFEFTSRGVNGMVNDSSTYGIFKNVLEVRSILLYRWQSILAWAERDFK